LVLGKGLVFLRLGLIVGLKLKLLALESFLIMSMGTVARHACHLVRSCGMRDVVATVDGTRIGCFYFMDSVHVSLLD